MKKKKKNFINKQVEVRDKKENLGFLSNNLEFSKKKPKLI